MRAQLHRTGRCGCDRLGVNAGCGETAGWANPANLDGYGDDWDYSLVLTVDGGAIAAVDRPALLGVSPPSERGVVVERHVRHRDLGVRVERTARRRTSPVPVPAPDDVVVKLYVEVFLGLVCFFDLCGVG